MFKKILMVVALLASLAVTDINAGSNANSANALIAYAPNDGTYMRTSYSVTIYTESGHPKGVYAVYLHHGKHYIDFNNAWICIQGRSRFGYNGNWYIIR